MVTVVVIIKIIKKIPIRI